MRWQLNGPWPVRGGAWCIPAGTIVGDGGIPASELPMPMPLNAEAMDEASALQMLHWYPPEHWHLIKFVHGINRDAVIAKRWGRK